MHPDTKKVAAHMRDFGLTVLGRATYSCTFNEMMAPMAHAMAVVQAAHGAEMVIKARIAEEHPLLIFTDLPRSTSTKELLTVAELFDGGRTVQYLDLPEVLWACTGYRIARLEQYRQFGKYRNMIMHFSVPNEDWSAVTLRFMYEVLEPMIQSFWGESIMPYASEWDEVTVSDGYLEEQLKEAGVEITPQLRKALDGGKN